MCRAFLPDATNHAQRVGQRLPYSALLLSASAVNADVLKTRVDVWRSVRVFEDLCRCLEICADV